MLMAMQSFPPPGLTCSRCDWTEPIRTLRNLCPRCSAPLLVSYELSVAPDLQNEIRSRTCSLWRFLEVLPPVQPDEIVTLGEGCTPLLPAPRAGDHVGLDRLLVKDESLNPTASFKARGMAVAVTMARSLGAASLAAPTAGNAGAALAAYAARAGMSAFIAMPSDTPASIVRECRRYDAQVVLVDGLITDAARIVQEEASRTGAFDLSTLKEPYRIEGKKTMAYELFLELHRLPDVIIYPTGGGTGLIGMWKAFGEMQRLGWIDHRRPRLYSVQSVGCAPIVRAFEQQLDHAPEWSDARTSAWGLRVPRAIGDRLMLAALRESKGGAVAVEESDLHDSAAVLRQKEGIDAGPEGGASLAAARRLVKMGLIRDDEQVVIFNTGAAKYGD
jgi:threonine synthase